MKKERCQGSKYIQQHILKGYKLCFSHKTDNSIYGHAMFYKSIDHYTERCIGKSLFIYN